MRKGLEKIDGLSPLVEAEISAAPDSIWTDLLATIRPQVLDAYSHALNKVWWLTLAFAVMCLVSALFMRNLNIKAIGEAAAQARLAANSPTYAMEAPASESVGGSKSDLTDVKGGMV